MGGRAGGREGGRTCADEREGERAGGWAGGRARAARGRAGKRTHDTFSAAFAVSISNYKVKVAPCLQAGVRLVRFPLPLGRAWGLVSHCKRNKCA